MIWNIHMHTYTCDKNVLVSGNIDKQIDRQESRTRNSIVISVSCPNPIILTKALGDYPYKLSTKCTNRLHCTSD